MITKTVGTGGDFANWDEMMLYLDGTTHADDLDIQIISDNALTDGFDAIIQTTSKITISIHSDSGRKKLTNFDGQVLFTLRGSCVLKIYDLSFEMDSVNGHLQIAYYIPTPNEDCEAHVYNCKFKNVSVELQAGVFPIYIYNNILINNVSYAGGIAIENNSNPTLTETPLIVENCTIYRDWHGQTLEIVEYGSTDCGRITVRNVVSISENYAAHGVKDNSSYHPTTYINCADDDGSFPVGTNIYHNIVLEDEFASLDFASEEFLSLNVSYDGVLVDGGVAPSVAGIVDFVGNPRPSSYGYAIGCYEAVSVSASESQSPSSSDSPSQSPSSSDSPSLSQSASTSWPPFFGINMVKVNSSLPMTVTFKNFMVAAVDEDIKIGNEGNVNVGIKCYGYNLLADGSASVILNSTDTAPYFFDGIIRAEAGVVDDTAAFPAVFDYLETSNSESEFTNSTITNGDFESEAVIVIPGAFSTVGSYHKEDYKYNLFSFVNQGSGSAFWEANDFNYGMAGERRAGIGYFYFYSQVLPQPVPAVTQTEYEEPEVENVEFWSYLTTFFNYLDTSSREMFENFWTGMVASGNYLNKLAKRFRDAVNPEASWTDVLDDYYEIVVGPLTAKPISLDPTSATSITTINAIGTYAPDPEYDSDNNKIYHDFVQISKADYDIIRDICIGTYAIIKVKKAGISDRFFKVKNALASSEEVDGDRYWPPSSTSDTKFGYMYMLELEDADLTYIGSEKFTVTFTTARAYDVASWISDIPDLQNYVSPNLAPKFTKGADFSFINSIVEFNHDIFDDGGAEFGDTLYCRFAKALETNGYEQHGRMIGIDDLTKFNFDNEHSRTAISSALKGVQNATTRIDYERALNAHYGLPIANADMSVIGVYESYSYTVIGVDGNTITLDIPPLSLLSEFVCAGARLGVLGKSDIDIDYVNDDRSLGIVVAVDASDIVVGDSVCARLYNRYSVKNFYKEYEDEFGVKHAARIDVYANGGVDAINHVVDTINIMAGGAHEDDYSAPVNLDSIKRLPEVIIFGTRDGGTNYDGVYHIAKAEFHSPVITLTLYMRPGIEEPLYDDFIPSDSAVGDTALDSGFAHIPWPTHKYLFMQHADGGGVTYKAYLDAPIDTIYEAGDFIPKYTPLARNVSVLNKSAFKGWSEFDQFRLKTGLNEQSDILELVSAIPGAEFGKFFPSDVVV